MVNILILQSLTKTDFDATLSSLNRKIMENKTKHFLVENELNKLKTFDSCFFIGKSHFEENGTQNYLVFQPLNKYFQVITNTDYISSWKSKGFSAENIKPPTTSDNSTYSNIKLLWYQNKSKIYWNLFKTTKSFIYSKKSSKYLHCL